MEAVGALAPRLLVLAALLGATVPAAAIADEGEGSPPTAGATGVPPTVSFVEQQPPALTFSAVKEDGLSVELHNDAARKQRVELRVIGLEQSKVEAIATLLSTEPESKRIRPGGTKTMTIPIGPNQSGSPTAGKYPLQIVASGAGGGLARQTLTVEVPVEGTKPEPPVGISVEYLSDLTFGATNYVPSPLSHLPEAFLVLGLLLALLAYVFRASIAGLWQAVSVIAAVVLLACGGLGLLDFDFPGPAGVHRISSDSVPLSGETTTGTVGALSNEYGDVALLKAKDGLLSAADLSQASAYTGKFKLSPEEEKGEAKATVNVRDFWLWAFFLIAAGVSIGLLLHGWFGSRRGERKLRLQAQRALDELSVADAEFAKSAKGRPYAGYTAQQAVSAQLNEIDALLDDSDTTTATEKIKELLKYVRRFKDLRTELAALDGYVEQLKQLRKDKSFGVDDDEAFAIVAATELMQKPFDSPSLSEPEKRLTDGAAEASKLVGLVAGIVRLRPIVVRNLAEAEAEAAKDPHDEDAAKRVEALKKIGRELDRASSTDALPKLSTDTGAAADALAAVGDETALLAETPQVEVVLRHDVLTADGTIADGNIYLGDEVILVAQFTPPVSGVTDVEIAVDDATTSRPVPSGEPWTIELPTSFWQAGDHTASVRTLGSAEPLATSTLKVDAATRTSLERGAFAKADREMSLLAFALAVSSGLLTLYFADAHWGEPQDYLAALLWGGVTAEGVKLAGALADKVWPAA